MRLTKYEYSEHPNSPNNWRLQPLSLGGVNLVVGKNASGKSRTLSTVVNLSKLVSGRQKVSTGAWDCTFEDSDGEFRYELETESNIVVREVFKRNDVVLLDRTGTDGSGKIRATKTDDLVDFQTPNTDLACVNRRDATQHAFFDKLHDWGMSVFYYTFGTAMGKEALAIIVSIPTIEVDLYNQNMVIAIFRKGEKEFGAEYVNAVKADMEKLGYPIEEILVSQPTSAIFAFQGPIALPAPPLVGLSVKERELTCVTDQIAMSQGMFRALSVLIQFNYCRMCSKAGCVIVDDIGEGLDFERSCDLISLLVKKSASNVQLVLSTNDRFVMNTVPLKSWTLLKRKANLVSVFNYSNSQKHFDEFRFTGLNNFDFFATDFLSEDLEQQEESLNEKTGGVH